MSRITTTLRAALAGGIAVGVMACSAQATTAPKVPEVFDLDRDPAADIAPIDPSRGEVVAADQLRLLLENHLAWHGITLVEAMRGAEHQARTGGSITSAAVTAWTTALVANTDDITHAIGLVYGPVGARAFHQLWAQHTQFLVDYASASGRGDQGAMDTASRQLDDYVTDSGSLFATATAGGLPAATARQVLHVHVAHMKQQIRAITSGDVDTARDLAMEDHGYLIGIADALATAISGQQPVVFPGSINSPASDEVSAINQQAGATVLGLLGTKEPLTTDPFGASAATDTADVAAGGWSAIVPAFDAARTAGDATRTVTTSRDLLDAANSTATAMAGHHHPG